MVTLGSVRSPASAGVGVPRWMASTPTGEQDSIYGRGERASPVETQRSIRFLMVNETPRSETVEERSA
jgi:hypothetical protein